MSGYISFGSFQKYNKINLHCSMSSETAAAFLATFHGIREGIEDESVFDTPRECEFVNQDNVVSTSIFSSFYALLF